MKKVLKTILLTGLVALSFLQPVMVEVAGWRNWTARQINAYQANIGCSPALDVCTSGRNPRPIPWPNDNGISQPY